jgi:hypothetical protein
MSNFTIAASILVSSVSAFADGATYEYPQAVVSTVTRAQVLADLKAAQAQGALMYGERSYVAPTTGSAVSRDEVRAELAAARAKGELPHREWVFVAEAQPHRTPSLAGGPVQVTR